jgi:hypothetical protein
MHCKRANKKWTTVETLALQREYELLEMSVYDIATKHERSVKGILYRLKSEGFITSFDDARGYEADIVAPYIEASDISSVMVNTRLTNLENSIEDMRDAIDVLVSKFNVAFVKKTFGRDGKAIGER